MVRLGTRFAISVRWMERFNAILIAVAVVVVVYVVVATMTYGTYMGHGSYCWGNCSPLAREVALDLI